MSSQEEVDKSLVGNPVSLITSLVASFGPPPEEGTYAYRSYDAVIKLTKIFGNRTTSGRYLISLGVQNDITSQVINPLVNLVRELCALTPASQVGGVHMDMEATNEEMDNLTEQLLRERNRCNELEDEVKQNLIKYARLEGRYEENGKILLLKDDLLKATKTFSEAAASLPTSDSYASVTRGSSEGFTYSEPQFHVFLNPINQSEIFEKTREYIANNINLKEIQLRVNGLTKVKNGVKISFPSQEDLRAFVDTVVNVPNFKERYTIREVNKKQPQFLIKNVPDEMSAEELFEGLEERYSYINARTATLVHSFKARKGKHFILEVTPDAYKDIINHNYLYCGWFRFYIDQYVSVRRCTRCLKLGHSIKRCPEPGDFKICRSCGSTADHIFKYCKDVKCINCLLSNKNFKTLYDPNHFSTDLNCPCYSRIRDLELEKVDYGR